MRPRHFASALFIGGALALAGCAHTAPSGTKERDDAAQAQARVDKAASVVDRMKTDPKLNALLRDARGVLIVPEYGKAALVVGGQGGVGVLAAREPDSRRWSDPSFYTLGGLSIGLQAGGAAGPMALILMTDKAVKPFEDRTNRFSLSADAGLTVVVYSEEADISTTGGAPPDVVAWSGTKGLFGGVSVGASDVMTHTSLNEAYYHSPGITPQQILTGQANAPGGRVLTSALDTRVASK
jgi:lipid-binding SYLF domain-containing protein